MNKPLRIGIIGLSAERGWATAAHIPALRALSDDFELAGVANTSFASARDRKLKAPREHRKNRNVRPREQQN
jgi:predicted dehydrogenase